MARQSASTPVKAENYVMSESPHHGPGYDTAYGSPGSGHWEHDGAQVEGHPTYPPPSHVPSYEWGELSYPNPYHGYANLQPQPYGRGSPAASVMSDRSGRNLKSTRTTARTKPAKETRAKKSTKTTEEPKDFTMPGPISLLGKDSSTELFDIEAYVNRSMEERKLEYPEGFGIKRPMNCFIMYRKVYQERIKEYAKENNHQHISCLVTSSWKQESSELRDKFAEYAQIERENLQKAWPDYKFQPKAKSSKKRKGNDLSEDELSDLDGSDPEWGRSHRKTRSKHARRVNRDSALLDEDVFGSRESSYGWDDGYQHTTYQSIHPGRPPPVPMNHASAHESYYPQMVQHGLQGGMAVPYSDPMGPEGPDPLLGQRVSGLPGMPDALLNGSDQTSAMDPMLQEPWSAGAFTSDQFNEYSQYPSFGDQVGFADGHAGESRQEGQFAGSYQDADIETLLRTGGSR